MLLRPPTAQKPWQRALSFAYSTRDGTNDRSRNHAAPGLAFALYLVPRGRWGELPLDLNAFQVAANAHRAADLGTVSVQHGCQRLFLLRLELFRQLPHRFAEARCPAALHRGRGLHVFSLDRTAHDAEALQRAPRL